MVPLWYIEYHIYNHRHHHHHHHHPFTNLISYLLRHNNKNFMWLNTDNSSWSYYYCYYLYRQGNKNGERIIHLVSDRTWPTFMGLKSFFPPLWQLFISFFTKYNDVINMDIIPGTCLFSETFKKILLGLFQKWDWGSHLSQSHQGTEIWKMHTFLVSQKLTSSS